MTIEQSAPSRLDWDAEEGLDSEEYDEFSGAELAVMRYSMGLSQPQLGDFIGVATDTLKKWEGDFAICPPPKRALIRALYIEHLKWVDALEERARRGEQLTTRRRGKMRSWDIAAFAHVMARMPVEIDWSF